MVGQTVSEPFPTWPGAAEMLRRYRVLDTSPSKCLERSNRTLSTRHCSKAPEQEMAPAEFAASLFEEYLKDAQVPGIQFEEATVHDFCPLTLRQFRLQADCGQHVVNRFGLKASSWDKLGMFAGCTAAATYAEPVTKTAKITGAIKFENVEHSKCLGFRRAVPFDLRLNFPGGSAENIRNNSLRQGMWYSGDACRFPGSRPGGEAKLFEIVGDGCEIYSADEHYHWVWSEEDKTLMTRKSGFCLSSIIHRQHYLLCKAFDEDCTCVQMETWFLNVFE